MEFVTLNNGIKMPKLGYGVYQTAPNDTERAVSDALEIGYRLIDTAAAYDNEQGVGAAIRQSGIPREDLFVTTKLWVQDHGYDNTLRAFDTSMKKLGLDYLDLYLIHKPYGDYYGAWRAMEKLYKEGRIRAIGVTSFWNERLADLANMNEVKPAVNQIETNVWDQKWSEDAFMKEIGIQHEAWLLLPKEITTCSARLCFKKSVKNMEKPLARSCCGGSYSGTLPSSPSRYEKNGCRKTLTSLTSN